MDLVEQARAGLLLPAAAERYRIRSASGVSSLDIARKLQVARTTVIGWESGKHEPRGLIRANYALLLQQLKSLIEEPS